MGSMNRIRLLPEHVANQIAAGEVVERPASVVKELVENALDAQATRLIVEIQAGGRSLIRVTDDGIGMNRDDALLALERHATSKIQKAEDLTFISTMGFRGEAIPSIASVSRMNITTRERDSENPEGTQIVINGGKILEVKAAGCATGTSIEVRQIFFNLPARRKFLRSEETERSHIQHYLTLVALAYPHVACSFIQDGRVVWQLPAVAPTPDGPNRIRALEDRFAALYSRDIALIPVDFNAELRGPELDDDGSVSPAELKKIDSDTAQLLYQIKDNNRALGEYLHNINRKIELLTQRLMAEHKPAALTRITRQVNLSEGGIAFGCEKPIAQQSFIAMRLTFLPSYAGLILFAKVIRCELSSAGDYQIAAKFHRINDSQQQLIGQQIMRAQMAERRLKQQY